MKKYVSLSNKSLASAYEWASENPMEPLARCYMSACVAVGEWMRAPVWEVAGDAAAINEIGRLFYEARDRIGRMVLARIKRESAQ